MAQESKILYWNIIQGSAIVGLILVFILFFPEKNTPSNTAKVLSADSVVSISEYKKLEFKVVELKCDVFNLQQQKKMQDSIRIDRDSLLNYLLGFNEIFEEEYPWISKRIKAKMMGIDIDAKIY